MVQCSAQVYCENASLHIIDMNVHSVSPEIGEILCSAIYLDKLKKNKKQYSVHSLSNF